jgi:5'-nucleotidase
LITYLSGPVSDMAKKPIGSAAVRILITNDDGVSAPGIAVLAHAVQRAGHDVIVVAPNGERSGSGAAMGTVNHGTEIEVTTHDLDGITGYAVDGPPALCSLMGFFEVFGPRPDMVLSGVNPGLNTGRGLLQSGTVGAVLTAADLGMSGAALSIDMPAAGEDFHWATAAQAARAVLAWLVDQPRKTAVNVNVPNVVPDQIEGFRWGRIAAFGPTSMSIVGAVPGRVRTVVVPRLVALKPDTDTALVAAGFVSVTTVVTPRAAEPFDASSLHGYFTTIGA